MNSAEAYIVLNLLPNVGPVRVAQLVSILGSAEAIFAATEKAIAQVPGIGGRIASTIAGWRELCDLSAEIRMAEKAGITLVTRADPDYPELLQSIYDPPLCLYVRGDIKAVREQHSTIAIVGSRRTTRYGVEVAEHLSAAAGLAGWTVVAGLARGIDTVAHEATLRVKGRTVAILGSGLSRIYPQENVDLARRIAENGGALISEFPMTFPPDRRTFPMRNRIISGMTRGTIVVEAGLQSGSLITANQALEQGRTVFAVPGRVDSPQSQGCHRLLKDGAVLVETFGDVLDEFQMLVPHGFRGGASDAVGHSGTGQPDVRLNEIEQKIMSFVGFGEAGLDELIGGVGEPPAKILSSVVSLEMRHLLRQLPGKRVARALGSIIG